LSRYAGAANSEVEQVLHSLPRATRNRTQNATPARHSIVMNVVTAIRTSWRRFPLEDLNHSTSIRYDEP
jgi:hypothetical protein